MDDEFERLNGWLPVHRKAAVAVVSLKEDLGRRGYLIACDRTTGDPVAFVTVSAAKAEPGTWHVGLWTTPGRRGHGFASEALKGALEVVHQTGIETVHIGTTDDNHRMQHVIRAAGGVEQLKSPHVLPDRSTALSIWYRLETHAETPELQVPASPGKKTRMPPKKI